MSLIQLFRFYFYRLKEDFIMQFRKILTKNLLNLDSKVENSNFRFETNYSMYRLLSSLMLGVSLIMAATTAKADLLTYEYVSKPYNTASENVLDCATGQNISSSTGVPSQYSWNAGQNLTILATVDSSAMTNGIITPLSFTITSGQYSYSSTSNQPTRQLQDWFGVSNGVITGWKFYVQIAASNYTDVEYTPGIDIAHGGGIQNGDIVTMLGDAEPNWNSPSYVGVLPVDYTYVQNYNNFTTVACCTGIAGTRTTISEAINLSPNTWTLVSSSASGTSSVPVPASVWMFSTALSGFWFVGRRRDKLTR